jgi:hypothetical protein
MNQPLIIWQFGNDLYAVYEGVLAAACQTWQSVASKQKMNFL